MQESQESMAEAFKPPSLVTLSPFTPSFPPTPRRLSSCFSQATRPVNAARQLAWVSLQGRLVDAEEASSARAVGGFLNTKEALAWELFTPIHRILIVAVVAVAAMNSKKNRHIIQLKNSVQLRDQVLSSMQQKLDTLCEQVNYFKDHPEAAAVKYTCQICEQHKRPSNDSVGHSIVGETNGHDMFKICAAIDTEPEERRMSDLSDWAPSVASSVDIQLNPSAIVQDVYNLRKECEEKDTTIMELSTLLHSSDAFGSKRIAELEELIRRKNMVITRLKKDILVLEQKVMNLSRLKRPSYRNSTSNERQLPFMTENVLYDIDSSTSPSSSDNDTSPKQHSQSIATKVAADTPVLKGETALRRKQTTGQTKIFTWAAKQGRSYENQSQCETPLKERSLNQTTESFPTLRVKHAPSSGGGDYRSRRRPLVGSRDSVAQRRWV